MKKNTRLISVEGSVTKFDLSDLCRNGYVNECWATLRTIRAVWEKGLEAVSHEPLHN